MTPAARRAYRRFATFFLAIGSVFLMLGLARATFLPDVLRGNPVPVALLLLAIGGGLRWTVRIRPGEEDEAKEASDAGAEALGAAPDVAQEAAPERPNER